MLTLLYRVICTRCGMLPVYGNGRKDPPCPVCGKAIDHYRTEWLSVQDGRLVP